MISSWHKIDLHIHTDKSKLTKDGDYSGEFDVSILSEKLIENNVNMVSLTDHNIINCNAYEEIFKHEEFKTLVGVELDIAISEEALQDYVTRLNDGGDETIEIKPFHILVIFKSEDFVKINELLDTMFRTISEHLFDNSIDLNSQLKLRTTTFRYLFETFREEDFFIISHGNKTKGIVKPYIKSENLAEAQNSILLGEISALEMSSNIKLESTIKNYNEGFQKFLADGFQDFTTSYVVFSDNHNCTTYESGTICTWIKGHLDYETLRIGFSDPESRIHTSAKPPRHVTNYIEKVDIKPTGGETTEIHMSPYLNVIIGGRSSGKSLLFNTLIALNDAISAQDKSLFNDIYSNQIDVPSTFVKLNTGEESNNYSLKSNAYCQEKIIDLFNDGKDLKNNLAEFFIDFEPEEISIEESKVELIFNELKNCYRNFFESLTNLEKGDRLSQIINSSKESNKLFQIDIASLNQTYRLDHHEDILKTLEDLEGYILNSNAIDFKGVPLFSDEEVEILEHAVIMVSNKKSLVKKSKKTCELIESFFDKTKILNTEYIENELAQEFQLIESAKAEIETDIRDFKKYFIAKLSLRKTCANLEDFSVNIIDRVQDTSDYKFLTKLNFNINTDTIIENLFVSGFINYNTEKSIFENLQDIANPEIKNCRIRQQTGLNGKLPDNFDNKVDDFINKTKPKKQYLIVEKGDSEISTDSTSQGRKASIFLDVKLNSYFDNNENYILMIDQIEDNIDNKYISENLVSIIRALKNKMQIILVTHNPSIAIYGDAENIIICENNGSIITYKQGGLENEEIRHEACQILDGGDIAFRNRMQKYNIEKLKSRIPEAS